MLAVAAKVGLGVTGRWSHVLLLAAAKTFPITVGLHLHIF
jgi:hypothetical protein